MKIYAHHQNEIEMAWDAVERRIDGLPSSLAGAGRAFLSGAHMDNFGYRDYFSGAGSPPLLYLPLWLRDRFRREERWPRPDPSPRILLAGIWGAFHIRIQDEVLEGGYVEAPEQSLFGNVCIAEMFAHLHAVAGGLPSFWPSFERAWTEFSRFTLEERRQAREGETYPAALLAVHARKMAFARIPSLAACAVAGRLDMEGALVELIQMLGIAYGLVDGLLEWPRDIHAQRCTYLPSRAGLKRADLVANAARNADDACKRVLEALYEEGLLDNMLFEAAYWQERAGEAGMALGVPEIRAYTSERLAWFEAKRRNIEILKGRRASLRADCESSRGDA